MLRRLGHDGSHPTPQVDHHLPQRRRRQTNHSSGEVRTRRRRAVDALHAPRVRRRCHLQRHHCKPPPDYHLHGERRPRQVYPPGGVGCAQGETQLGVDVYGGVSVLYPPAGGARRANARHAKRHRNASFRRRVGNRTIAAATALTAAATAATAAVAAAAVYAFSAAAVSTAFTITVCASAAVATAITAASAGAPTATAAGGEPEARVHLLGIGCVPGHVRLGRCSLLLRPQS
mmetsp:Transcript_17596/g.43596  ORF Transcript_17596/g.43596 Transcript_17596/m.43596 type:complete len:232 (-) Transcript_17596:358-1053(-)